MRQYLGTEGTELWADEQSLLKHSRIAGYKSIKYNKKCASDPPSICKRKGLGEHANSK